MRQIYTTDKILKLFKWLNSLPKERLPFVPVTDNELEELLVLGTNFDTLEPIPDTFADVRVNMHGYTLSCRHGRLSVFTCKDDVLEMYVLKGVKGC